MCGRFTLTASIEKLREQFPLFELPEESVPRYNVAPTQLILAVRQAEGEARPRGVFLRWGLVPSWADDLAIGNRLINARADTVAQKPSFRAAFKKRRCLILADGFYEWIKEGKKKQPYHIRLKDGAPFAFAGLWEFWKKDEEIESCTILTTDANDTIRPLHDRMPVILEPRDFKRWLDPAPGDPGVLLEMLRPYPAEQVTLAPVSVLVNNPRNERAECVVPLTGP